MSFCDSQCEIQKRYCSEYLFCDFLCLRSDTVVINVILCPFMSFYVTQDSRCISNMI